MTTQREPDTSAEVEAMAGASETYATGVEAFAARTKTDDAGWTKGLALHLRNDAAMLRRLSAAGQAAPVPPPVIITPVAGWPEPRAADMPSACVSVPSVTTDGTGAPSVEGFETTEEWWQKVAGEEHDRAEGLAKEVERLQRQIESFEADADYHRAQRETIKRHEDQIRDLKVMVSAAEAKLASYEAPVADGDVDQALYEIKSILMSAADGGENSYPDFNSGQYIERLLRRLSAAHAECKGENTKLREALRACQTALAMMISPDAIKQTSVLHAFAHATEAEAKARAALAPTSEEKAT